MVMRERTTAKKILTLVFTILPFPLVGFVVGYLAASQKYFLPSEESLNYQEENVTSGEPHHKPSEIEYTFKQGDTFFEVLADLEIPPQEIFQLMESSKKVHRLKRVDPGSNMTLKINSATRTVDRLEYPIDNQHLLSLIKEDKGYRASVEERALDIKLRTISGTIRNSLFEDGSEAGCPPQLILNFADIFAWEIDFFSDLRAHDTFTLVFEELYKDGKFINYGKIVAAALTTQGKRLWVFYYQDPHGDAGYYNEKGESVARMFLKSPLRYSRISSKFTKRRLHPILRIYRPHLGVDYAAPKGTPIEATAEGNIISIGWKGGYGKSIKIKHNHIYTSFYGHLCRFAKGRKQGKRVKQGQVIGYVGATGLATGPHLDYRLQKVDKFVDPLKLISPCAELLSHEFRAQFEKNKLQMMVIMQHYKETLMLAKADVSL